MADWMNKMMSKGKEVAEVTRLNTEISKAEQRIRTLQQQIGVYVSQHRDRLNLDDELTRSLAAMDESAAQIVQLREAILVARNVVICPNCKAEIVRSSRFCTYCGGPIPQPAAPAAPAEGRKCPFCYEPVEEGMAFCTNCGEKLT